VHADIRLHHDGGDSAASSFLVGFYLGPIFAIAQTVAKPSMPRWHPHSCCWRPPDSDVLKNDFGAEAVRHSLLSPAVTTALGTLLFVWAVRFAAIFSGRVDPISSPPASPLCFYYRFDPGPRPAARSVAGRSICM
jgi:hypothetical protein